MDVSAVDRQQLQAWIAPHARALFDDAVTRLCTLQVLVTASSSHMLQLNSTFKREFRNALTGGGTLLSFGVPDYSQESTIGLDELHAHATSKWECILHY